MAQYHEEFGKTVERAMHASNEELLEMNRTATQESMELYDDAWGHCVFPVPPEVQLAEYLTVVLDWMVYHRGLELTFEVDDARVPA